MSVGGYKIRNKQEIHFLTFAVVGWVDVFTRLLYRETVTDSLKFCQQQKGLLLHGWCLMSNHLHLLASAKDHNLSDTLRDFKKFTAGHIIRTIESSAGESRREWMLRIFREEGRRNSRNGSNQFWRQDNRPMECYSPAFTVQKLNYIHLNPVRAGIVAKAEDYLYSSVAAYHLHRNEGILKIDFV